MVKLTRTLLLLALVGAGLGGCVYAPYGPPVVGRVEVGGGGWWGHGCCWR